MIDCKYSLQNLSPMVKWSKIHEDLSSSDENNGLLEEAANEDKLIQSGSSHAILQQAHINERTGNCDEGNNRNRSQGNRQ